MACHAGRARVWRGCREAMRSTCSGSPAASSQARNPRFATNGFSMKMAESRKIVLGSCIVHLMKYKIDQGSSPESLVNICYETLAWVCGVYTLTLTYIQILHGVFILSLNICKFIMAFLKIFSSKFWWHPACTLGLTPTICE